MGHANDVRPYRVRTILTPAMRNRLKDCQRPPALRRQAAQWRLAPLERLLKSSSTLLARPGQPILLLQRLTDDPTMHERVLSDVQRRYVKAERVDSPQQAFDRE